MFSNVCSADNGSTQESHYLTKGQDHRPLQGTPFNALVAESGLLHGFWEATVTLYTNGYGRCGMQTFLVQNGLWCHPTLIYRLRALVLRGTNLISLAVFHVFWPRGNHHETNVWLHHTDGRVSFYAPSQISRAKDLLGMSKNNHHQRLARQCSCAQNQVKCINQ